MTRRPSAVKDDISNVVDDTDSDAGGINTTPSRRKKRVGLTSSGGTSAGNSSSFFGHVTSLSHKLSVTPGNKRSTSNRGLDTHRQFLNQNSSSQFESQSQFTTLNSQNGTEGQSQFTGFSNDHLYDGANNYYGEDEFGEEMTLDGTGTTDGTYYTNDYDDTLYGDDETACDFMTNVSFLLLH